MIKKYSSIFFDLDDTLLDFKAAEKAAVKKVLERNGLPCSEEAVKNYSLINQSYWERFERGEIPKTAIFAGRFQSFLELYGEKGDPEKISKEYSCGLSLEHQTVEGAHDIVKLLKSRGYKVYATTNGLSSTQYRRIKESGLGELFDGVFVSEDAGHQKPEKEYFDYVISNIAEKDKEKMLIIGDSPGSDILGGINSGIDVCWYNPSGKKTEYEIKYEVKKLSEIDSILK